MILKRDDLFPIDGGGSKARMLNYILTPESTKNIDVLVTAGGPLSNFNRACALHCASIGLKMHLVCYSENESEFEFSQNYFIVRLANVTITKCLKSEVAQTINKIMNNYAEQGIKAKNIYGGGRCSEGFYSYYQAVKELKHQVPKSYSPTKLFVACGTGTTTAGISAGLQDFFPDTELHAISVARTPQIELPILKENIELLNKFMSTERFTGSNIIFHDEFIGNGYGSTNPDLNKLIKNFVADSGILLDPIYSGKAFYGMSKIIEKATTEDIVFWHTGALYTLLSEKHLITT